MKLEYRNQKNLPCDELYRLFLSVGWVKEESMGNNFIDKKYMLEHFNCAFLTSTFVFSAWIDNHLVGCIRAISDLHFRSVIYDLAVLPKYQKQGIGTELVKKCISMCPNSEWLVQTDCAKEFYETIGFKQNTEDVFLTKPCIWF